MLVCVCVAPATTKEKLLLLCSLFLDCYKFKFMFMTTIFCVPGHKPKNVYSFQSHNFIASPLSTPQPPLAVILSFVDDPNFSHMVMVIYINK